MCPLSGVDQTWRGAGPTSALDPKLASRDCQSHNRVYMDDSAVDERERGVLLTEGQCKIGPAKHDCVGRILFEQLSTNSIEDQTLGLGHNTGRRHCNVGLVHIIQVLSAWGNDLGASDASIESRLHNCASSENSDPFEAAFFDGPANLGNHVDNR